MTSDEKTCTGCSESWPDDKEFFFSGGHRRLMSVCKACYTETHRPAGSRSKTLKATPTNCIPAAALQGLFHGLVARTKSAGGDVYQTDNSMTTLTPHKQEQRKRA